MTWSNLYWGKMPREELPRNRKLINFLLVNILKIYIISNFLTFLNAILPQRVFLVRNMREIAETTKRVFMKIIILKGTLWMLEQHRFQSRLFARAMRLQNITEEGRSPACPFRRLYPLCSYVHRLPRLQTVSKKYSTDDCIESDCSSSANTGESFSLAGRTYTHHSVYTLWHKCPEQSCNITTLLHNEPLA